MALTDAIGSKTARGIGYGLQGLGNWMSSEAQSGKYVSDAETAELASKESLQKGQYEAWRNDVFTRQLTGDQMAEFGAMGLELQGTAIDVLSETMKERSMDKMMALRNARMESEGYAREASSFRKAARSSRTSGLLGLAESGVGIASAIGLL
jgi:hypothetical protein